MFWQTSRTTSGCKSMLFSNYTSSEHFLSTLLLVNRHFKTSQVSRPPVVNQPVLDSSGSPHLRNIMTFKKKFKLCTRPISSFFIHTPGFRPGSTPLCLSRSCHQRTALLSSNSFKAAGQGALDIYVLHKHFTSALPKSATRLV